MPLGRLNLARQQAAEAYSQQGGATAVRTFFSVLKTGRVVYQVEDITPQMPSSEDNDRNQGPASVLKQGRSETTRKTVEFGAFSETSENEEIQTKLHDNHTLNQKGNQFNISQCDRAIFNELLSSPKELKSYLQTGLTVRKLASLRSLILRQNKMTEQIEKIWIGAFVKELASFAINHYMSDIFDNFEKSREGTKEALEQEMEDLKEGKHTHQILSSLRKNHYLTSLPHPLKQTIFSKLKAQIEKEIKIEFEQLPCIDELWEDILSARKALSTEPKKSLDEINHQWSKDNTNSRKYGGKETEV